MTICMDEAMNDLSGEASFHEMPVRHVGYVGLAGVPNVGKSTLVNQLVGQKVSIVSERPQTTRERLCGIVTTDRLQAVLVDIPGIAEPRDGLGRTLLAWVDMGLRQCDVVWHLRDARRSRQEDDPRVLEMIHEARKPVWIVWNKIDRVRHWTMPPLPPDRPHLRQFAVSALRGQGVDELLGALEGTLPVGELLFDPDQICDRDMRFMAAELVREQLFRHLGQEIPYAMATRTEIYDEEREGKTYILVYVITEREAHKPIVIGKGGSMLKKIGQQARVQIEQLLGEPVFLELRVKVRPKWRSDERQLSHLGLKPPISG